MSARDSIREALRQQRGITVSQLARQAGIPRRNVYTYIDRLNDDGFVVVSDGCRPARYAMLFDPADPRPRICAWDGCTTQLRRTNRSEYCSVHSPYVTNTGQVRLLPAGGER